MEKYLEKDQKFARAITFVEAAEARWLLGAGSCTTDQRT